MYVDYNGWVQGQGFGPDWVGTFAQYCRRQAGWYRETKKSQRRELEIAAHLCGYRQMERYVSTKTGRASVRGRWE